MDKIADNSIVNEIKQILFSARENVAKTINNELLTA